MPRLGAKRRHRVTQACDACRKRKVRCDGSRPTCGNCIRQQTVCVFPRTNSMTQRLSNVEDRMKWLMEAVLDAEVEVKDEGLGGSPNFRAEAATQHLTLYYELIKLISSIERGAPAFLRLSPNILYEWPLRYARAAEMYMGQVEQLTRAGARLSLDYELRACDIWYGISSWVPKSNIIAPLIGTEKLLDPSLPCEARDIFIAGLTIFSINMGMETDSKLFSLALSQAHSASEHCRHIPPQPVHFLALVFMVLACSMCGFTTQIKQLTEQAKDIGMRLGVHRSEEMAKLEPEMAERLSLAWWTLYTYDTSVAILIGQAPWSLDGVTTAEPKFLLGHLGVLSYFTALLKLYEPVHALFKASYEDVERDRTDEVRRLDARLEHWSSSLPKDLCEVATEKHPRHFPLLRMHLMYCILKCILWSKLALIDQNPTASRTCEQVARRVIVLCYENPNFAKKHGLIPFHADFAYSIIFLNGVLFPHRRWVCMDIKLMERTMDSILNYAFPLVALELKKAWNLRIMILRHVLVETSPDAASPPNLA